MNTTCFSTFVIVSSLRCADQKANDVAVGIFESRSCLLAGYIFFDSLSYCLSIGSFTLSLLLLNNDRLCHDNPPSMTSCVAQSVLHAGHRVL